MACVELLEKLGDLRIGVVGIGQIVLVAIEVEVDLMLEEEGQEIRGDVEIVSPELGEHGMMLC